MSQRSLTLSSEPTQGDAEGCLIKSGDCNQDMAGDRDSASIGLDARNFKRNDCDEIHLNATNGRFAVAHAAGRMGKAAQRKRFESLPVGDSIAANLKHGRTGPLSARPGPRQV
jgi:hypothetical protein